MDSNHVHAVFCRTDPQIKWEIKSHTGSSAVTAIECYDITTDGVLDLLIGKDDGHIEIYVFDENDKPKFKQSFVSFKNRELQGTRVVIPNACL